MIAGAQKLHTSGALSYLLLCIVRLQVEAVKLYDEAVSFLQSIVLISYPEQIAEVLFVTWEDSFCIKKSS